MTDPARERNRAVWEAGDWDAIADNIAVAGDRLLDRIGVAPGVRLLDVGTGSGGAVAIPAAQRGADVVGADITDAWFPAARRRAGEAGVEIDWVVGDAVALPFEDASFDVVTSTFGHMFAPDQRAAARELVRVCRPAATIALCCWTPDGAFGRFFTRMFAALEQMPPAGHRPPSLWGSEPHVAEMLEELHVTIEMRRATIAIQAPSPEAQTAMFEANFGPVVGVKQAVGERWPAVRAGIVDFLEQINERDDGTMAAEYEYLETIGHTAA